MADILKVKTGSEWRAIAAIKGEKGDTGATGAKGDKGDMGTGVPTGGATGQVLKKNSDDDFDFQWAYEAQNSVPWGHITGTMSTQTDLTTALSNKQATLVSGTNIKTLNNESLLGSGNIDITSATWGNIQGTLSNQTDLQTALDGKADDSDVEAIEALIPSAATSSNQLADKSFVNSSIATNTANYISNNGEPFTSVAELEAYSGTVTNNDYAFVTGTDSTSNTYFDRYKATVSGSTVTWAKEYRLNNSSFTAAQWAAITSGITSNLVTAFNNKYDLPSGGIPKTDLASAVQTSLGLADTALQSHQSLSDLGITATATELNYVDGVTSNVQVQLDGKYVLPATGMPKTDLASDVQTSLGLADTALQTHQSLSAYRTSSAQDVIDGGKIDDPATKSSGQFLKYNGSTWVADTVDTGVTSVNGSSGAVTTRLLFTNQTISTFTEESTPTYEDFPYVGTLALSGVTASDFAMVTFDATDATSGEYAPVVVTYAGGIYVYRASALGSGETLTIPSIVIIKG